MDRLRLRPLLILAGVLAPDLARACAVCIDVAGVDRGFNWAFVGLMLAPFAVAAGLAAALVSGPAWRDRGARQSGTVLGEATRPAGTETGPLVPDVRDEG